MSENLESEKNILNNKVNESLASIDTAIKRIIELQNIGDFEQVDDKWVEFDEMLADIENNVSKDDLEKIALTLLEDNEGLMVNAGLSILALPNVVSYFKEKGREDDLSRIFEEYIPESDALSKFEEGDADSCNFIRSVEGLIGVDPDGDWNDKISSYHEDFLKDCCSSPDMEGTLVFDRFSNK